MQEIGSDDVCLGQTAGDVHAVGLLVEEADPFLEIAQHLEGVVSELVAAIVVDTVTTELTSIVSEIHAKNHTKPSTYRRHQAVDVCPDMRVHDVVGNLWVLHLGQGSQRAQRIWRL
jgi:hypothetical protein